MHLTSRLRARLLVSGAAATAAAFVLSGCGPVEAGSAALVGSSQISVDHLQRVTSRVLATPTGDQQFSDDVANLQRIVLSRMIDTVLLHKAAAQVGVTVAPADVNSRLAQLEAQVGGEQALIQQAVASGISPAELNAAVADIALQDKLSTALVADVAVTHAQLEQAYQQNIDTFDQVHAAHILVKTKAQAQHLLNLVRANPQSFAALAKQYSLDQQSGQNGGDLGTNGAGAFVPQFGQPVFAAKPGSYIIVHSQYGWHVVHVISHTKKSLAEVTPQLRAQLLQGEASNRLQALITDIAKKYKVTVNPRYGQWNRSSQTVVEASDTLSRPAGSSSPVPTSSPFAVPGG